MERELTKKQSAMIQGIAVLLMVYHHFFLNPAAVPGIAWGNAQLIQRVAWFGKLCVGLFCFVSGYGMYHSFTKLPHARVADLLEKGWKTSLVRLLRLYTKLWLVILVFKGIDFLFLKEPFRLPELLGNLAAVQVTYNGTWWFVGQYVIMLLLLPLLDLCFTRFPDPAETKKQWRLLGILFTALILGFGFCYFASPRLRFLALQVKNALRPAFTAAFINGYLFARFRLFSRFCARCLRVGAWMPDCAAFLSLCVCILLRVLLARDASFAALDFLFAPLFIFGTVQLLSHCRVLPRLFCFFGSCSTYLWLTHVLVYDHTVGILTAPFASRGGMPPMLFYLTELALSTAVSFLPVVIKNHLVRRREIPV